MGSVYRIPRGYRLPVAKYPPPYERAGAPVFAEGSAATGAFTTGGGGGVPAIPTESSFILFTLAYPRGPGVPGPVSKVALVFQRGGAGGDPAPALAAGADVVQFIEIDEPPLTNDAVATAIALAINTEPRLSQELGASAVGTTVAIFALHAGSEYDRLMTPAVGNGSTGLTFNAPEGEFVHGVDPQWIQPALWGPQRGFFPTLGPEDPYEFPAPG